MEITLFKNAMAGFGSLTIQTDWTKPTDDLRELIRTGQEEPLKKSYELRKKAQSLWRQMKAGAIEKRIDFESIVSILKDRKQKITPALILSLTPEPDKARPKVSEHRGNYTGLVAIDVDHLTPLEVEKYKSEFIKLPFVSFAAESFSGFGIYVVCVCDVNTDNFRITVEKLQEYFLKKFPELKGKLDEKCKDCTRMRFLALDPELKSRDCETITPFKVADFKEELDGFNAVYVSGIDKHFDKEIMALATAKDGRHEPIFEIAIRALSRGKLTKNQILQALITASKANGGNHEDDVARQVANAYDYIQNQREFQRQQKANNSAALELQNFVCERAKNYCFDVATALYFPAEIKGLIEKTKNFEDLEKCQCAQKQDELIAQIMRDGRKAGLALSQKQVAEGIYSELTNNQQNSIDTFQMRALKLVHYAQITPKVNGIIDKFCKEMDFTEYESRCFKKTLIAICAKALEPSVLHQQMLILTDNGQQGLNKTKFWNSVALVIEGTPAEASFEFNGDKDQKIKKVKHCLLLMEECENLDRKDAWELKKQITEPFTFMRLPYDRDEKKFWNRAVFVGLTNKEKMLNSNDERARRFWVIKVTKKLNCEKQKVFELMAEAALIAFNWLESPKGVNYLKNYGNVVNESALPPWADLEEEKIETIQKNRLHKNHDNVTIAIVAALLNIEDQNTKIRVSGLDQFANWIVTGGDLQNLSCVFSGGRLKEVKTVTGRFVSAQMVKDRIQERVKNLSVSRKNRSGKSERVLLLSTLQAAFIHDIEHLEKVNSEENEIDQMAEKESDYYELSKEGESYVFV